MGVRTAEGQGRYCENFPGCTTPNGGICTGDMYIDAVLMIDEAFVNRYPGGVVAARAAAQEAFWSASAELTNALYRAGIYNVIFNMVHFTSTILPNSGISGMKAHYASPQKACIRRDIAILYSGDIGGGVTPWGQLICTDDVATSNHVPSCMVGHNTVSEMAITTAHELMHNLGIMGHSDYGPGITACGNINCLEYLMCERSGVIRFAECDVRCVRKIFCRSCNCFRVKLPVYSDPNHDCTGNAYVRITTNQPYLIRGCQPNRHTAVYTVTVYGNERGISNATVEAVYQDQVFDFASSPDFNIVSAPNVPQTILRNTLSPFNVPPGEIRTFTFTLEYNPIDSTINNLSVLAHVKANLTGTLPVAPFTWTSSHEAKSKTFYTYSGNSGNINIGNPAIIKGDFNIMSIAGNYPFVFEVPLILVDNAAAINVKSNATLVIEPGRADPFRTLIQGCDEMWKGVNVETGGRLIFTEVTVKDAQMAIQALPGVRSVKVTESTFGENNLGVVIRPNAAMNNILLQSNRFSASGNFLPYFFGQSPVPFEKKGFCGIYAEGVTSGINTPLNIGGGTVNGLHYGIITKNTAANISGIVFDDMTGGRALPSAYQAYTGTGVASGKGIYAQGSAGNMVHISGNAFSNCLTGIEGNGVQLNAKSNSLGKVNYGIIGTAVHGLTATDNTVEATHFGIGCGITGGGNAQIQFNRVTMDVFGAAAGIVTSFAAPSSQTSAIDVNTVKMKTGVLGMWMLNNYHTNAIGNVVSLNEEQTGMRIEAGSENIFDCNTVDTLQNASTSTGIYAIHPAASVFKCNQTANLGTGLFFQGELDAKEAVTISGNRLKNHATGLVYGAATVTGPQEHQGNIWEGSFGIGARHDAPELASRSRYTVDVAENSLFLPPSYSPLNWFEPVADPAASFTCPVNCQLPGSDDGETAAQQIAFQQTVAQGTAASGNFAAANNWLARRRLYGHFLEKGVPAGAVFSDFMTESQQNGVAAYANVERLSAETMRIAAAAQTSLAAYAKKINDRFVPIQALDKALAEPYIPVADSIALEQDKQEYADSTATDTEAYRAIWAAIQQGRSAAVPSLLALNDGLQATEIFQINEKTVNDIVIRQIISGQNTLSDAQRGVLEAIAAQCALSGGEAVLRARAILAVFGWLNEVYDDEQLCFEAERPGIEDRTIPGSQPIGFRAFPNPAHNTLDLVWYGSEQPEQMFRLTDTYGRTVSVVTLNGTVGRIQIETGTLQNGLYLYQVSNAEGLVRTGKIMVQH